MNKTLYDSLDPALQTIVDEAGQEACKKQRELNRAGDKDILARLGKGQRRDRPLHHRRRDGPVQGPVRPRV